MAGNQGNNFRVWRRFDRIGRKFWLGTEPRWRLCNSCSFREFWIPQRQRCGPPVADRRSESPYVHSVIYGDSIFQCEHVFFPSSSGQPENRALVFAGQEIPEFEVVYTAPVGNVQNWAFVMDSQGNLIAIKTAATGTLMTEVHRLSKASNYQEFDLQVGTCLPYASDADTWSFVMASNDDLVAIKKGPHTGTGMTEVHRMSAASNYQKFTLQTGTALHLTNDADSWSFAMDEHDDLLAIKKGLQTGTGCHERYSSLDQNRSAPTFWLVTVVVGAKDSGRFSRVAYIFLHLDGVPSHHGPFASAALDCAITNTHLKSRAA